MLTAGQARGWHQSRSTVEYHAWEVISTAAIHQGTDAVVELYDDYAAHDVDQLITRLTALGYKVERCGAHLEIDWSKEVK